MNASRVRSCMLGRARFDRWPPEVARAQTSARVDSTSSQGLLFSQVDPYGTLLISPLATLGWDSGRIKFNASMVLSKISCEITCMLNVFLAGVLSAFLGYTTQNSSNHCC